MKKKEKRSYTVPADLETGYIQGLKDGRKEGVDSRKQLIERFIQVKTILLKKIDKLEKSKPKNVYIYLNPRDNLSLIQGAK